MKRDPTNHIFRCTRCDLYAHNCIGRDNLSARQGHYVEAENADLAFREMQRRYPNEKNFTVELWEE